jgi:hypothetical protein
MNSKAPTRVVIGGGLFGCFAALVLADRGHDVLLVEQGPELLSRASMVNQARLHTGLHYPRSLLTASEALTYYRQFRRRFPTAVRDFTQIYAVSRHNSKVSGDDFANFIIRLGMPADEVDPNRWFHAGTIDRAFRVEEPTFDYAEIRRLLSSEMALRPEITVNVNSTAMGGEAGPHGVRVDLAGRQPVETQGVVLATYAGTNALRRGFGLDPLPITFELAEVVLGTVAPELRDMGFTVMDGPFWSMMPFGLSDMVSLTSVGLTPQYRSTAGQFPCQESRGDCQPLHIPDCTSCPVRPQSTAAHKQRQMALYLKQAGLFTAHSSLFTVKAVLTSTEVDDARPTIVRREDEKSVWSVLSGKVSTLFDLEDGLT